MSEADHNEIPDLEPPSSSPRMPSSGPDSADPDAPEKPPIGVRTMAVVRWAILAFAVLAAVGSWWSFAHAQHGISATALKYQCPMHPQIVQDGPGECPICHMNLEPVSADRLKKPAASAAPEQTHAHVEAGASSAAAGTDYICTMCPEIHSDKPGRCSKCGMDLVAAPPKPAPAASSSVAAQPPKPAAPGAPPTKEPVLTKEPLQSKAPSARPTQTPGAIPPGTTPISLGLDRLQSIGVRTTLVEEKASASALRATAVVSAPEQNVAEVHVRAAGFVEGISVRETGVQVKAGQALVAVYSPEIYQAQSELLATKDWALLGDGKPGGRNDAARRKLELLGVSSKTADKVIASGKPFRAIGLSAPISGVITKKNVVLGSYVTPETTLYEIVDLSKVYIVADIFQQHASRVALGTTGRFASSNRRDVIAEAKVDLIYPQVNLEARTTRVRMQVQNAKLGLLPGEYGTVEFMAVSQLALVVPRDAIIDTGEHVYVFVEDQPGHFTPHAVQTGAEVGDTVEILAGVAKGDKVVSGATFLLDSESRLQASLAAVQ
ncbi:MAG: efflux RND transporter periplasmic adaptor subunit [Deltaproteobacteria bacterium]|nr:efflux RND transporter periplasmic adaptor subunit [Deltaproteobacteria bacterium]